MKVIVALLAVAQEWFQIVQTWIVAMHCGWMMEYVMEKIKRGAVIYLAIYLMDGTVKETQPQETIYRWIAILVMDIV